MKRVTFVLMLAIAAGAGAQTPAAAAAWEKQAKNVTITRDDWGIAHVYGKTDADAVFGLIYEQAEDDFNRVETNFINSMGRLAEAEGEKEIYRDLRMKLFINPDSMRVRYWASPAWLQKLCVAWADGLNFYLYKHPEVKPRVIKRFEPWMALTFSEGSIGGDIESVNLGQLEAMYGSGGTPAGRGSSPDDDEDLYREPSGSNGIAIAPANTVNHHALLLINPHTSFFFRSEVQVTSDEGLNAYGAVTWGQFFIYQGFNERIGWMHTTSGVNDMSDYAETVTKKGDGYVYAYAGGERSLTAVTISVPYKTAAGMAKRDFTVYYSHHGPIVRKTADGKWVAVKMMQEQVKALTQSYARTKPKNYKTFAQMMDSLHTNSSNNTIFADADGDIAYFHGNFIPRRDPKFDWTKPVDGSDPATEWQGLLSVEESPLLLNPASGLHLQLEQLAVVGGGSKQPEEGGFPELRGEGARGESARISRAQSPAGKEGLHAELADRRGVRQLHAVIRADDSAAAQGVRRCTVVESAQGETGGTGRRAARVGLPMGCAVRRHVARRLLGRGRVAPRGRRRAPRRHER